MESSIAPIVDHVSDVTQEPPQPWREFWGYFSANHGAVAGLLIVLAVLLLAALAPWIAPYPPDLTNPAVFLKPPAWQTGGYTGVLTDPTAFATAAQGALAATALASGLAAIIVPGTAHAASYPVASAKSA